MRPLALIFLAFVGGLNPSAFADELPVVVKVDAQPLGAQVRRLVEALELAGQPLDGPSLVKLEEALAKPSPGDRVRLIQETLDPLCLLGVTINPESRVKVDRGPAQAALVQHEWRVFLVKVTNLAGVSSDLVVTSPNAAPLFKISTNVARPKPGITAADVADRWMDLTQVVSRPMTPRLSALAVEYRLISIYSRDAGPREAKLAFSVGPGTQDLGFRGDLDVLFACQPAVSVTLEVLDVDGKPCTAGFTFRDARGRVYPSTARRLAPDFWFQPQVYRQSGETVDLAPGKYSVEVSRGPEYEVERRTIEVPRAARHREAFQLRRWTHLAKLGWFSGDHHIHGAGCGHYERPTEGVAPDDMIRHVQGEDLNVGCVLSWGPCWYAQKTFFEAKDHKLSTPSYLMRYDVEVSGFPSSPSGHVCLLRLKEDDYPGTTAIEDWPSWDLPILKWAKTQGAVVGFAHSGFGLKTDDNALPSLEVPAFDGVGAMEYIVDVTHDAVDFLSTVDSPAPWELSIWYHTLNCGYRQRISGETDFPCLFGERVGVGRSYVRLADGVLNFDRWVEGIKDGRSYVSDGKSHLIDFTLGEVRVGEGGSERKLEAPGPVDIHATVIARLDPEPSLKAKAYRKLPLTEKPYWDLERARIEGTQTIPVDVVVNGKVVATTPVLADGQPHEVTFRVEIARSSWVALRIYPSSHTNPIFVTVADQPIRASRSSAEWCLKSVDACWASKSGSIRKAERADAQAAYDFARTAYRKILEESPED
jgi:hypothetical protein